MRDATEASFGFGSAVFLIQFQLFLFVNLARFILTLFGEKETRLDLRRTAVFRSELLDTLVSSD